MRAMPIFRRKQPRLGHAQSAHCERGRDRYPDEMNPRGRRECAVDDQGAHDDDRPDDKDQECGRAVADVEAVEVESAAVAAAREAHPPVEERARPALRTKTAKS